MKGGTAVKQDGSLSWVDFHSLDELIKYTEAADIGWISLRRYLKRIAGKSGGKLLRRQELPPEAFYDWKRVGFAEFHPPSRRGKKCAIVVSHAWWSKEHPDPDGRQVKAFVKHMESALDRVVRRYGDIPVFWDFCSLYQHPRTASQEKAFQRALCGMHVLYAHERTCVVQLEGVPDDAPNPTPYHDRGWTTFEQCIARAKVPGGTFKNGGIVAPPERLGLDGAPATPNSTTDDPVFLMSPERFDRALRDTKVFSYRSDLQVVSQLYRTVVHTLAAGVTSISFFVGSMDDNAVEQLVEVLPMYTNLETLALHATSLTTVGVAAIVKLLKKKATRTMKNPFASTTFRSLPKLNKIAFNICHLDKRGQDLLRRLRRLRPNLVVEGITDQKITDTKEIEGADTPANTVCNGGCGFFAAASHGYCSKCSPPAPIVLCQPGDSSSEPTTSRRRDYGSALWSRAKRLLVPAKKNKHKTREKAEPNHTIMPHNVAGSGTEVPLLSGASPVDPSHLDSFSEPEEEPPTIQISDDGSIGQTVAGVTSYEEDHQKVVNKNLLDAYGDKGLYTGVVLRSTAMVPVPHGSGRMVYDEDGRIYEGDWHHGRWHGYGRAMYSNGDSYEGEHRLDRRHGRGIYHWRDGRVYCGSFSEDTRHGEGTLSWPDGAKYEGDFVHDQREGHGSFTFGDGGQYVGGWRDGRYDGLGVCVGDDGRCYRGEWRNGMAHGEGVETYADGRIRHNGRWIDGNPVG